jgi:hypothetical protein
VAGQAREARRQRGHPAAPEEEEDGAQVSGTGGTAPGTGIRREGDHGEGGRLQEDAQREGCGDQGKGRGRRDGRVWKSGLQGEHTNKSLTCLCSFQLQHTDGLVSS